MGDLAHTPGQPETGDLRMKRRVELLCVLLAFATACPAAERADLVLGDFEGPVYTPWTATGDAFGSAPLRPELKRRLAGAIGLGLATSARRGIEAQGHLLSPVFSIQRHYLRFLVAGERYLPGALGVELLVDGRVVRAASASEGWDPNRSLYERTWDVTDLAGRNAQVRVNDRSAFGAIAVDQFVQSDTPQGPPIDASRLLHETYRPQFHFTAQAGWLNDPNGLFYYRGVWHLFHQHRYPGSGATMWGHAQSRDLLHWQHLPTAIPAEGQDAIFSGTGMVDGENASGLKQGDDAPILLFYTLHPGGANPPDDPRSRKATQCMAYSTDGGRTFTKYVGNPLLRTADFNDRDPKVFYYTPSRAWYMVLSLSRNNRQRDKATYGFYRSKDLKTWELIQEIGPGAWYWECPDMFPMRVDGDPHRTKWLLLKSSGEYLLGTFDGGPFRVEAGPLRNHWGPYYATQTFSDAPAGRRIQIGWMNTPKAAAPNSWPGMPFNQQMGFPRELSLRTTADGPRLRSWPVAEIAQLYAKTHSLRDRTIQPAENAFPNISHDLLDIDLELDLQQAAEVRLTLRGTPLVFDVRQRTLKLLGRTAPLTPVDGRLALRLLLDRTSIEIFANQGEVNLSGVFFPNPANKAIALTVAGGPARIHRLEIRELRSIW
jgi:sucrose-6-phosphate hydrolase SacC (GH32 family)